jgi:hypothetical protein
MALLFDGLWIRILCELHQFIRWCEILGQNYNGYSAELYVVHKEHASAFDKSQMTEKWWFTI